MKKRVITMLLLICMAVSCFAGCGAKETLYLFLPGEYLGDGVIEGFEKAYNCRVKVENFDSNEMMYAKLSGGSTYDVLIPSDYMIERLLKENSLQPLDKSLITNLGLMADGVKNLPFDPDNTYSVPYFWGTVGIIYDNTQVSLADLEAKGFEIFKDSRYNNNCVMYDSERDSFMIALKSLGYSCNTESEKEINEAYEWLLEVDKNNPLYMTDDVISAMIDGKYAFAIVYSGDAVTISEENEKMDYFCPSCGTNVWFDSMVIPKNAKNPELANKFINYMLTYEAALANSEGVGYASPNAQVLAELSSEGGSYAENSAYLPRVYEKDEVFHDNAVIREKLANLWTKVLAEN